MTPLCTLSGHQNKINQANWHKTGRYVVTASDDGTARIWDVEDCSQIGLLEGHSGFVNQAVWDPEGRRIVTAGDDGTARIYYVRLDDLRALACQRAMRNMSGSEWRQFMGAQPYHETCPGKPVTELP